MGLLDLIPNTHLTLHHHTHAHTPTNPTRCPMKRKRDPLSPSFSLDLEHQAAGLVDGCSSEVDEEDLKKNKCSEAATRLSPLCFGHRVWHHAACSAFLILYVLVVLVLCFVIRTMVLHPCRVGINGDFTLPL